MKLGPAGWFSVQNLKSATVQNLKKSIMKQNIKMSRENTQKKEGGPDRSVSDNQSSSVTLNELAMKARKSYRNFKLQQRSHTMTDVNLNDIT